MDLKEAEIPGIDLDTHWYYTSKWQAIKQFLPKKQGAGCLWDIGGGSGYFSKRALLSEHAEHATSIDIGYDAPEDEILPNGAKLDFRTERPEGTADIILFMDVLEHVDDDVALLKQYGDHLSKDGIIVITVPAFQFLWSAHDVFLEHKRRYTKAMLWETIHKAGYEPVKTRFFFGSLFPLIAIIRVFQRLLMRSKKMAPESSLKQHSRPINTLLTIIHSIERAVMMPWNSLYGLSIICTVRRKT